MKEQQPQLTSSDTLASTPSPSITIHSCIRAHVALTKKAQFLARLGCQTVLNLDQRINYWGLGLMLTGMGWDLTQIEGKKKREKVEEESDVRMVLNWEISRSITVLAGSSWESMCATILTSDITSRPN
jgi:hypothetical protein